jgi:hypothetical protein
VRLGGEQQIDTMKLFQFLFSISFYLWVFSRSSATSQWSEM